MEWRAGQNHATSAQVFLDLVDKSAIKVLQAMALIDDDIAPIDLDKWGWSRKIISYVVTTTGNVRFV